jgi:hypothetical protein
MNSHNFLKNGEAVPEMRKHFNQINHGFQNQSLKMREDHLSKSPHKQISSNIHADNSALQISSKGHINSNNGKDNNSKYVKKLLHLLMLQHSIY